VNTSLATEKSGRSNSTAAPTCGVPRLSFTRPLRLLFNWALACIPAAHSTATAIRTGPEMEVRLLTQ
jgi:hypothetical protein